MVFSLFCSSFSSSKLCSLGLELGALQATKEIDKHFTIMKYGMRTPSWKKSLSARTKGRATRAIKRAIIPGYGKRGMGWLNPKKAVYNRVYRRTTFSIFDLAKASGSKNSGCCVTLVLWMVLGVALWTAL